MGLEIAAGLQVENWDSYSWLPLAHGTYHPQAEQLGSWSSRTLRCVEWGLRWGIQHTQGSRRVYVILWASSSRRESQERADLGSHSTFPPDSESDQALFPRGWGQGKGGSEGSKRERRNSFPNASKRAKVPVLRMEAITQRERTFAPLSPPL